MYPVHPNEFRESPQTSSAHPGTVVRSRLSKKIHKAKYKSQWRPTDRRSHATTEQHPRSSQASIEASLGVLRVRGAVARVTRPWNDSSSRLSILAGGKISLFALVSDGKVQLSKINHRRRRRRRSPWSHMWTSRRKSHNVGIRGVVFHGSTCHHPARAKTARRGEDRVLKGVCLQDISVDRPTIRCTFRFMKRRTDVAYSNVT